MSSTSNLQPATAALAGVLRDSAGLELSDLDKSATFIELGFDSLFLIQMSQRIKQQFGVKVAFRQLIEDLSTIDQLVRHLAKHGSFTPAQSTANATNTAVPVAAVSPTPPAATASLPSQSPAPEAPVQAAPPPAATTAPRMEAPHAAASSQAPIPTTPIPSPTYSAPVIGESALERLISEQNALMSRHLDLLSGQPTQHGSQTAPTTVPPLDQRNDAHPAVDADSSSEACSSEPCSMESVSTESCESPVRPNKHERFGPYKPVRRGVNQGLTDQQRNHLDSFIARYTARTAKSKQHAQNFRQSFADPRGVAGYRRAWKSVVYQIAVERSKGCKLWDIDGNEYIDIAMGFGVNLFGQSPDFVTKALHKQLERGVEVGPQSPLAGEVAELLCQFSRKDRVTFCNTGSEAVMAALRLARTVTGKTKTVYFNKDYHGNFDQVLLRSQSIAGQAGSSPAAPGVPFCYSDNTIVLDYCNPNSLRIIEENADDIAAVLVEPVQSADPFLEPREFLTRLRQITKDNNIALVMDEVITGFRAKPGGAQEYFNVWGDMATYGKILGGGMPIGALAGTSEYMDALDGGYWKYDDDSEPDADMTFFAGTFVRHPLAIAAAHEILKRLKEEGPDLQERLTELTTRLVTRLNTFFEDQQFPIRVAQFTSLFRIMFPQDIEFADMLYFHLLDRGIFTRGWGDNCFLSTQHSEEDIERVYQAITHSCLEIRDGGFFPDPDDGQPASEQEAKELEASAPETTALEKSSIQAANTPTAGETSGTPVFSLTPQRLSTINEIQDRGDRPPLFCMPAADGLTLVYHELSEHLGPNQPVYGLDSPGIYKEPIPDTLEELSARFIEDLREIQPHGPYHLIGYCSGGTTALDVAQQLIASGEEVGLLGCLETYNWQDAPSTNPSTRVEVHYQYERLKYHVLNFLFLPMNHKRKFLASKLAAFRERLNVWKGMFAGKPQRQGEVVNMAEIWKKHDDIAEAYAPKHYPGRLLQIRPRRDYKCHLGSEITADDLCHIKMRSYPAAMMVNPFVEDLAAVLESEISESCQRTAERNGKGQSKTG